MGGEGSHAVSSCLVLERPGKWHWGLVALVLGLIFLPALPLVLELRGSLLPAGAGSYGRAVGRSLRVALGVSSLSLVLGLPLGVLIASYRFPGRSAFLGLFTLPLLTPSFLWAIGLSSVASRAGLLELLSGSLGSTLSFLSMGFSLVALSSGVAYRALSSSQIDALRSFGSGSFAFRKSCRAVLPTAALASLLAGLLTLSDPGPGQILGFPGAASEILTTFSAHYDFGEAVRQCLFLAAVVLLVAGPLVFSMRDSLAFSFLGRSASNAQPRDSLEARRFAPLLLGAVAFILVLLPLAGFLWPLSVDVPFARAISEAARTLPDTLAYAGIGSGVSTLLGFALAFAVGRSPRARAFVLSILFVFLCLPPSLPALGMVRLATAAPEALDFLLRGHFAVGLVLGLRLVPVAAVLAMRAYGASSPSWAQAAGIHGIRLERYLQRVLLPWLARPALVCLLVTGLLAVAEVGTVVLLRPPGADSFPVSIFTVMANAPEALVAALCLVYLASALGLLALLSFAFRRLEA
jgi:iron(III) transport system permease protein